MKTLLIDIETLPNLGVFWGAWKQNIYPNQVIERARVCCFAAGWMHEERIQFFAEWQAGGADAMLDAAHALLDEADVVVHYNGDDFDIPWLRTEMRIRHDQPYSPFRSVDLFKANRQDKHHSKKLAELCKALEIETKIDSGGMETWLGVMQGKRAARTKMRKYNIQDVRVLRELHDLTRPWIRNYPNPGLYDPNLDGSLVCRCGSLDVQKRGYYYSGVTKRQRYICNDCGSWSVAGRPVQSTVLRSV